MGRYIDPSKPLSDEDRAHLKAWARHEQIKQNDFRFGVLTDEGKAAVAERADADAEYQRQRMEAMNADPDTGGFDPSVLNTVAQMDILQMRQALSKLGMDDSGEAKEVEERLLNKLQDDFEAAQTE